MRIFPLLPSETDEVDTEPIVEIASFHGLVEAIRYVDEGRTELLRRPRFSDELHTEVRARPFGP